MVIQCLYAPAYETPSSLSNVSPEETFSYSATSILEQWSQPPLTQTALFACYCGIILPHRHLKHTVCLKFFEGFVLFCVIFSPAVVGGEIMYRSEKLLIIGFEHAVLQQLLLVIEQFEGKFSGIGVIPVENEA